MQKENKQGFTLIEILVVVAIILLLSGMLYRIGDLVDSRAKRAETVVRMQKLANALEEYHVVYGVYPNPTDGYTRTVTTNGLPERVLEMDYERRKELGIEIGEKFGLASFLLSSELAFKTNEPQEFISWDQPSPPPKMPDKNTRNRWKEFLDADGNGEDNDFVGSPEGWGGEGDEYMEISIPGVDLPIFPIALAFKDAWGKDLLYKSKFPNLSYTLFSKGPDGKHNKNNPDAEENEDDISVTSSGQ